MGENSFCKKGEKMMKNSKKKAIIVSVILIFVGLIVTFFGFTLIDFDINKLNSAEMVENVHEIHENFNNINVVTDTSDIKFLSATDEKCRIVCNEYDNNIHSVSVTNNTLTISVSNKQKWFDNIGIFWDETVITIYLPEPEFEKLSIATDTGDINITKDFSFENTQIETDTGDVVLNCNVKRNIFIETDTGDVSLCDTESENISIESDTGKTEIKNVNTRGKISAETDTGEVFLEGVNCNNLKIESSTGDISLKNTVSSGKMNFESDTGDISFNASDAVEMYIETDTGDVRGTLLSEKIFITQSDTGNINVPKTFSGGKCEIITNTGDIKLEISK